MIALDQNRVDVVFEISKRPKLKVRQINIIGNAVFSDDQIRGRMATKQARAFRLLSSATSYDQDRLSSSRTRDRRPIASSRKPYCKKSHRASCSCRPALRASKR
jgi:outer membrane protein insertion porin family